MEDTSRRREPASRRREDGDRDDYQDAISMWCLNPSFWDEFRFTGEVLGQGTFGKVVKVENNSIFYAVKLMTVGDAVYNTESKILQFLSRKCENVMKYYQSWIVLDYEYPLEKTWAAIVMEYISGPNLVALLRNWYNEDVTEYRKIPPLEVWDIMYHLTKQLKCIHDEKIVHGDIKLDNIVLDDKHEVATLVDYGSSCATQPIEGDGIAICGSFITSGTYAYMAPEVIYELEEKPIGISLDRDLLYASDIWSFGAVMFSVMVGQFLVDSLGGNRDEIPSLDILRRIEQLNGFYPEDPELESLVKRMLSYQPSDRPNATQILESLENMKDLVNEYLERTTNSLLLQRYEETIVERSPGPELMSL